MFRGKDLDKDLDFQERIKDPVEKDKIYGGDVATLIGVKIDPKNGQLCGYLLLLLLLQF